MSIESALVGYTGFVGGNLHAQHRFDVLFNSGNVGEIEGRRFDLLVLSATQARRWWANLHPLEDWEGIERLLSSIERVKARRVVLISTIDVLPQSSDADEDFDPRGHDNHAYGANRFRLEEAIKGLFAETSVVRLPSLFGPGLKKNVLFDLLNGNQVEKINPASSFQYYDLGSLWEHISMVIREGIPVVHLFPEPVTSAEVIDRLFPGVEAGGDPGPATHYALETKHAELFGGSGRYIWPREEVLRRMGRFVDGYRRGEIR